MNPLTRELFSALRRRFGDVEIASGTEGEAILYKLTRVRNPDAKYADMEVIHSGEQYRVNCPLCGDTRKRLFFSYKWGVWEPETGLKLHMMYCQNENCWQESARRYDLYEALKSYCGPSTKFVARAGRTLTEDELRSTLPTMTQRVDLLPADHPANRYLRSRNFNPKVIGKVYDGRYCFDAVQTVAVNRLIIPMRYNGNLRGWQARYLSDDIDWKSPGAPLKYYTSKGTKKGQLLYNFDQAQQYPTLVVVEGPMDVWRFGKMSTCGFGSQLSGFQKKELIRVCRETGKNLAIMLDEDVLDGSHPKEMQGILKLERLLKEELGERAFLVKMPSGDDPAALGRQASRKLVYEQGTALGLDITFTKDEE